MFLQESNGDVGDITGKPELEQAYSGWKVDLTDNEECVLRFLKMSEGRKSKESETPQGPVLGRL